MDKTNKKLYDIKVVETDGVTLSVALNPAELHLDLYPRVDLVRISYTDKDGYTRVQTLELD